MNNLNHPQPIDIQEAKEKSTAQKIQAVQHYFDQYENQSEKQETVLEKFGDWLNQNPDVREYDATKIRTECMNIIAQHGYKFTELPVHLIDLLNKFVSTEGIKTVKYCLEQHKLGLENILPSFKELVPEDVFECFRLSLMVHTGKKDIPDNEVERYIYALLDTSDTQHTHDRQKIQTQPTFRPAT